MRRRGGRARRLDPASYADDAGSAPVAWGDLASDEQAALKRLNRAADVRLRPELEARLVSLGLAARRPDGVGISRAGRALVIDALLQAVSEQDERR
ncbi:MAG: hypothetical protein KF849_07040 [Rhizobiaceae bacterium]|nr:hypothetical protein [Rhizobiaceae bacterium]